MEIIISHRNRYLGSRARNLIERRVESALATFGVGIRELELTISDENGPKGGRDTRCNLRLKLGWWENIFTSALHENPVGAAIKSVHKARRKLLRKKGLVRSSSQGQLDRRTNRLRSKKLSQ